MITVFLDESGNDANSKVEIVGAVATPDAALMEQRVVDIDANTIADPVLWQSPVSRRKRGSRSRGSWVRPCHQGLFRRSADPASIIYVF